MIESSIPYYWASAGYGLILFSLGLAIIVHIFAISDPSKRFPFLGLAGFSVAQGVLIWSAMLHSMMGLQSPLVLELVLVGYSFACLGCFGLTILGFNWRYLLAYLLLAGVIWAIIGSLGGEARDFQNLSRWMLAIPMVMIAVIAFIWIPLQEKWKSRISIISFSVAGGFFIFALTLISAPAGDLFIAQGLSEDTILPPVLTSMLAVRILSGFVIATGILLLFHAYEEMHYARLNKDSQLTVAELDTNRALLRSVFDLAPIGLALNRMSDGQFIKGNAALFEPSGYTPQEFADLSYWDLTPKEYEAEEAKQLESLQSIGRYGPYEKHYINKNGQYYPVLLNGVLLTDENGEDLIVSTIQDISVQKQVQNELENQRLLAEAANVSKTQFLANMSHEIRTPMNGVLGLIAALGNTDLSEKQRKIVDIVMDSGELLLSILNDILDFSKMEAGHVSVENIEFSVSEIFARLEGVFGLKAKEEGLSLNFHRPEDLPDVYWGDPSKVLQVMSNLVSNALKFTEAGSVNVSIDKASDPDHTGQIVFEVSDTGIGLTRDQMKHIFDRFTQADQTTTRRFGGTGLGLAIVHGLAEAMGGEITVKSQDGKGAVFRMFLPLQPGTATIERDKLAEVLAVEDPSTGGQSVLIAEDNKLNRQAFEAMLDGSDYRIEFAHNGAEALDKVRNNPFDLILMDIQMPVMGGVEALEQIRNGHLDNVSPTMPVIACTAHVFAEDVKRYLNLGFDDVLTKPVDIDTMLAKMKDAIEHRV